MAAKKKVERVLRVVSADSYTVAVRCRSCNNGIIETYEGNPVPCPYCKGTRERQEERPHPSHSMSKWRSEIRCPGSTPRFYGVRECRRCEAEELSHPAGRFLGSLKSLCPNA